MSSTSVSHPFMPGRTAVAIQLFKSVLCYENMRPLLLKVSTRESVTGMDCKSKLVILDWLVHDATRGCYALYVRKLPERLIILSNFLTSQIL